MYFWEDQHGADVEYSKLNFIAIFESRCGPHCSRNWWILMSFFSSRALFTYCAATAVWWCSTSVYSFDGNRMYVFGKLEASIQDVFSNFGEVGPWTIFMHSAVQLIVRVPVTHLFIMLVSNSVSLTSNHQQFCCRWQQSMLHYNW